jgi:hypothetical protein
MVWRRVQINTSAIPVDGVGGIGMLAIAAIIVASFPEARWLFILGGCAGAALAGVLILIRRPDRTVEHRWLRP